MEKEVIKKRPSGSNTGGRFSVVFAFPDQKYQLSNMRMARLELARREPHAPQACVSTNSTTSADVNMQLTGSLARLHIDL